MGADAGLGGQDSIPYSDSHHRRGRTMSMPDVAMVGVGGGGGGGGGGEESQDDANARAPRAASMEDAPPPVYEEVVVVMDERGKGRKKRGFWKGWR